MTHRTVGTILYIHVELHAIDTSRLGRAMHNSEAAFPSSQSPYRSTKVVVEEISLSCMTPTLASAALDQSCLLDQSLSAAYLETERGLVCCQDSPATTPIKVHSSLPPTFLDFSSFFAAFFIFVNSFSKIHRAPQARLRPEEGFGSTTVRPCGMI
jgi:hypothetical protein